MTFLINKQREDKGNESKGKRKVIAGFQIIFAEFHRNFLGT